MKPARTVLARNLLVALAALVQCSCLFLPKPAERIPQEWVSAASAGTSRRIVVVLPGQGDDLSALKRAGIAAAVQRGMPDTDVALIELTLAYYLEGRATQRLHTEVIEPIRQRGYDEIYLMGASMGGMGVLLYEREHPGKLAGLVLLAPFMGGRSLIKEIKSVGLAHWDAAPVAQQLNRGLVPNEEWRLVQSWLNSRQRTHSVWLVCGQSDRFFEAAGLLAQALPPDHYIAPAGGHKWTVWNQGAAEVFARITNNSMGHTQ
jgi:hypothetical protein